MKKTELNKKKKKKQISDEIDEFLKIIRFGVKSNYNFEYFWDQIYNYISLSHDYCSDDISMSLSKFDSVGIK